MTERTGDGVRIGAESEPEKPALVRVVGGAREVVEVTEEQRAEVDAWQRKLLEDRRTRPAWYSCRLVPWPMLEARYPDSTHDEIIAATRDLDAAGALYFREATSEGLLIFMKDAK
jgi:hypothetical protein